jgi:hypothetical protein
VFARYPYPESFFTWSAESDRSEITFFNRSDRRPPWAGAVTRDTKFPVVAERHEAISQLLLDRVRHDAGRQRRISAFQITLDGCHPGLSSRGGT